MVQADYGKAQYRPALFHNFGQIFGHKKSASKLANYQFHDSSMIATRSLPGHYHGARLDSQITYPKDQPELCHSAGQI